MATAHADQFAVCIDNTGYGASLETRKLYVIVPDADADARDMIRIVDESGDDYLYPKVAFREVTLPEAVKKAVFDAA